MPRFCAPFPRFKKITGDDQLLVIGRCIRMCTNPQMTFFTFKVYKNARDFDFSFNNIIWEEFNMTDNYFSGNNLKY